MAKSLTLTAEQIKFPIQTTFYNSRIGQMLMVSTAKLDPPGYWGDRPFETIIFRLDNDGAKNGMVGGLLIFPHYSPEESRAAHIAIARRARINEIPPHRLKKLRKQSRRRKRRNLAVVA